MAELKEPISNGPLLREQIMRETFNQYCKNGVRFSINDICMELSISTKRLYLYFPSKEQLISEVAEDYYHKVEEMQMEICKNDALDLQEKIHALLGIGPCDYQGEIPAQLSETRAMYPKLYQQTIDSMGKGWEAILALIDAAIAKGQIKVRNSALLYATLRGVQEYLLSNCILADLDLSYEEAMQEAFELLWHGIADEGQER